MDEILIRDATDNDCNLLYFWRNNKYIVEKSIGQRKVGFMEHKKFFHDSMRCKDTDIFIIMAGKNEVGMVRLKFNFIDLCSEISIYLVNCRGEGIGGIAMRQAIDKHYCRHAPCKRVEAKVRHDNKDSGRFFSNNGFYLSDKEEISGVPVYVYVYPLDWFTRFLFRIGKTARRC